MRCHRKYTFVAAMLAMLTAVPVLALTIGQTDTFEDGTTNGWTSGLVNPTPPLNIATGGPAGAGDNYLQLTASGGVGPGGRLVAFNPYQWSGDYVAAGAATVTMNLQNYGATDLSLRLMFSNAAGTNVALTGVVFLPSGSGWQSVSFAIGAGDLVVLAGTAAGALSAVSEVRLLHSPSTTQPGPAIAARLGVDNVTLAGGGGSSGVGDPAELPAVAGLRAVYPNPFNPRVSVTYALDRGQAARVSVHDLQGRLVKILEEGFFAPGDRTVTWDGTDGSRRRVASGAYIIELAVAGGHDRRIVTMVK